MDEGKTRVKTSKKRGNERAITVLLFFFRNSMSEEKVFGIDIWRQATTTIKQDGGALYRNRLKSRTAPFVRVIINNNKKAFNESLTITEGIKVEFRHGGNVDGEALDGFARGSAYRGLRASGALAPTDDGGGESDAHDGYEERQFEYAEKEEKQRNQDGRVGGRGLGFGGTATKLGFRLGI